MREGCGGRKDGGAEEEVEGGGVYRLLAAELAERHAEVRHRGAVGVFAAAPVFELIHHGQQQRLGGQRAKRPFEGEETQALVALASEGRGSEAGASTLEGERGVEGVVYCVHCRPWQLLTAVACAGPLMRGACVPIPMLD